MPAPPRPRVTAADRAQRRLRIYARLQEGWSHEAIAAAEKLSRERVRQIAKETLDRREVDPEADFVRLQMARLDPALRLAGERVAAGEVTAIDRLLRVLDRMDKYHGAAAAADDETEAASAPEPDLTRLNVDYRKIVIDTLKDLDRLRAKEGKPSLFAGVRLSQSKEEAKAEAEIEAELDAVERGAGAKFFRR